MIRAELLEMVAARPGAFPSIEKLLADSEDLVPLKMPLCQGCGTPGTLTAAGRIDFNCPPGAHHNPRFAEIEEEAAPLPPVRRPKDDGDLFN